MKQYSTRLGWTAELTGPEPEYSIRHALAVQLGKYLAERLPITVEGNKHTVKIIILTDAPIDKNSAEMPIRML